MRYALSMPKLACRLVPVAAALMLLTIPGCSGSAADSPEAKEARQKRAAAIKEDEDADKVRTLSGRQAKTGVMKSIKGRLGGE
jgi:hypothetical protein